MRICCDEGTNDEDVAVEQYELYVKYSLVTPLPGRERGRVWRHSYSKRVLLKCNNYYYCDLVCFSHTFALKINNIMNA